MPNDLIDPPNDDEPWGVDYKDDEIWPGDEVVEIDSYLVKVEDAAALMLDLRTDFSLPCKLIAEEHFLYDSIFTRI